MTIWGNHSATQYPDVFHAEVGGKAAYEVVDDQAWVEGDFIPTVQKRGAAIIEARGAVERGVGRQRRHRPHARLGARHRDGDWVSMGLCSDGGYGVPEGLISSFPVTSKDGAYTVVRASTRRVLPGQIDASVAELVDERDTVAELGLI